MPQRRSPANPQRFAYGTRLGFGLAIRAGARRSAERPRPDGGRVSVLRFWSASRLSLIREGRGYWSYTPTRDGVRFRTVYDYDDPVRRGRPADRPGRVFRPLIGWATAWSFDRLRLWLERGIDPASSGRLALVHGLARVGLAAIFAWHGLVPKLLGPDATERPDDGGPRSCPTRRSSARSGLMGAAELVARAGVLLLTWHRAAPRLAGRSRSPSSRHGHRRRPRRRR